MYIYIYTIYNITLINKFLLTMRAYSSRFSHLHLNINTNPHSNLCKYTSKVQKTSNTPIITSKTNKSKSSVQNCNSTLYYHRQIHCKIKLKHNSTYLYYCTKTINKIMYLDSTHMLAVFKDILISSDSNECLNKFYAVTESKQHLTQIIHYITTTSVIFPNYVALPESKFIYENIQGKQTIIDNQQEQELKELLSQQNAHANTNKHCKYYYNEDTHHRFFSQGDMYSILSQTDTSAIKTLMGLNNNNCSVDDSNATSCERIINTISQIETLIENKKHKIKLHKRPQQINLSLTTLLHRTKPLSSKGRNLTKTRVTNVNTNGSHSHYSINLSNNYNYNTTRNHNSNAKAKYAHITHRHRKTESAQLTKDILTTVKNTTLNVHLSCNHTHNANNIHKKSLINKLLRSNKEIIVIRAFRDINKQNKLSSQNALKKQKSGNSYRNIKHKSNQRKPSLIAKNNNSNVLLGNSNSMNLFSFGNEETTVHAEGKGSYSGMNFVPLTSRESCSRRNIKVGRSYKSKTPTLGVMGVKGDKKSVSISQRKTFASSGGNTAGASTTNNNNNGQQAVAQETRKNKEKKQQSLVKGKRYSLSPKQHTQRLMKSYSNSKQVSQGDLYNGNAGLGCKKTTTTIMPFKCSEISEFDGCNSNNNMLMPQQTPNSERINHCSKHKPKLNVNINVSNNNCFKPNNSKFINNIDILKSKKNSS